MSFKYNVVDKKNEIWDHEIELIVRDLPEKFRKFIPAGETMKISTGYPAYLTITIPNKNGFSFIGNYIINTKDETIEFVFYVLKELLKNGHHIEDLELFVDEESDTDQYGIVNAICKKLLKEAGFGVEPAKELSELFDGMSELFDECNITIKNLDDYINKNDADKKC